MKERLRIHREIESKEERRLEIWKAMRTLSLKEIRDRLAEHDREYRWDDEYIVLRRLETYYVEEGLA